MWVIFESIRVVSNVQQAAEDSPADTSKSDTELLDLDPLAPLDHINAVIKQLEEREAAAEEALARQRGFEAVPTLGTLEGSIFGELCSVLDLHTRFGCQANT